MGDVPVTRRATLSASATKGASWTAKGQPLRWGVIGMGPVGRRIVAAACARQHAGRAFDIDATRLVGAELPAAESLEACVADVDIIVSAVPASAARAVAVQVAARTDGDALYLEWSSTSPAAKAAMGRLFRPGRFVDVTLLDSITAALPLLCLAGGRAEEAARELSGLGFDARISGPRPGDAAIVKMVRSLFMKPLEALVIEWRRAAHALDPSGVAQDSIERTLSAPFRDVVAMLLETNRQHAVRRAAELEEVIGAIAPPSMLALLGGAHRTLAALAETWEGDAPPVGASAETLERFLADTTARRDGD
jgi:3-hydroxyisobutyrate dehydrogenase-like beta-hydroxyacid dehydrogenase